MPRWPSLHLPAAAAAARYAFSFALCGSFSSSSPASLRVRLSFQPRFCTSAACPLQEEDEQSLVVGASGRRRRRGVRVCASTSAKNPYSDPHISPTWRSSRKEGSCPSHINISHQALSFIPPSVFDSFAH
ncbi:hypothetical protein GUJ93_ZPchr0012g19634 [Zizania palustris]|uniref:Uncharacterized protein n=1 Tax=Zizania palustris TaxID=103762 RepID=A0A8J5WQB5_ZIZPA|nr:hypothetical protein GUJ93_ZPchr0012g19634 [Zizania palustris]KAG8092794.1 hypothetical protein GUJ93_ZPchr0012g19634 [Zizania palustris]